MGLLLQTKNFFCSISLKLVSNERWRLVRSQKHSRCPVMLISWKIWPKEGKTKNPKKSSFNHFASNGHIVYKTKTLVAESLPFIITIGIDRFIMYLGKNFQNQKLYLIKKLFPLFSNFISNFSKKIRIIKLGLI